ncbi:MAG: FG-GAP-like repeat-containing protein, partial [Bacteroidota bacterium]
AAYADLDKDGDLDLIVNNINQPAFLFRNQAREQQKGNYLQIALEGTGKNSNGIGARVSLTSSAGVQVVEQFPSRGYLSSVSTVLHVGLGQVDTVQELRIRWSSGKTQTLQAVAANQTLTLIETEAKGRFRSPKPPAAVFQLTQSPIEYQMPVRKVRDFDRQSLLLRESSKVGPAMVQGDLNGDGKVEVLIGGAQGQPTQLFEGTSPGRFAPRAVPAFEQDAAFVDAVLELFDANGDGALDLYVGSGGYHGFAVEDAQLEDRLYLNDGQGGFSRAEKAIPPMRESTGCVAVGDINGDGAADLFVGGRVVPGQYPEAPLSYLLLNQGDGTFKDATRSMGKDLKEVGLVSAAEWIDLNQDGQAELLLTGEWLPLMVFGQVDGEFKEQTPLYFDEPYYGWWNTLTLADVNADGRMDVIAGNVGKNTQFQPSKKELMEMVYYDFDKNESLDPVFTYHIQGTAYPYLTRDELLNQLSGLRSRFVTYASYANQTLDRIIIPGELNRADRWQATHTESMVFLQGADGRFTAQALPWEAQNSPVHSISPLDFNQDGKLDLLLCGNDHHFKLRIGQMDANYGVLLEGDGQGGFRYVPQQESGLKLAGDIRSVVSVGNIWLFGRNEASLVAYYLEENAL